MSNIIKPMNKEAIQSIVEMGGSLSKKQKRVIDSFAREERLVSSLCEDCGFEDKFPWLLAFAVSVVEKCDVVLFVAGGSFYAETFIQEKTGHRVKVIAANEDAVPSFRAHISNPEVDRSNMVVIVSGADRVSFKHLQNIITYVYEKKSLYSRFRMLGDVRLRGVGIEEFDPESDKQMSDHFRHDVYRNPDIFVEAAEILARRRISLSDLLIRAGISAESEIFKKCRDEERLAESGR